MASTTGARGTSLPVRCWLYDLVIRKAYRKQLIIMAVLAVLVISGVVAGMCTAVVSTTLGMHRRKKTAKPKMRIRQHYEQEKSINEREAQQRIDQCAMMLFDAAARAGRLQQQLVAIREQLWHYNAIVGAGSSAADTGVLLADVFSKSREK